MPTSETNGGHFSILGIIIRIISSFIEIKGLFLSKQEGLAASKLFSRPAPARQIIPPPFLLPAIITTSVKING
jgi:hypothetical protein